MDGSSEGETVVDESVELCNSPSVLTGLFQIRRASSQTQPNMASVCQVLEHESGGLSTSPDFSFKFNEDKSSEAPSQKDGASVDNSSQQSEKSQSIFTQRVPVKRKSPMVTLCSPVFARAPSLKLPRIIDDTSSSTDTHLSESPSFQGDYDQVANESPSVGPYPNERTQSSITTFPSEQEITPEPKHLHLAELKQSQATPLHLSLATQESPNLVRNQETHQLEVLEQTPRQNSGSLKEATYPSVPTSSQRQLAPTPMTTGTTFNSSLPDPNYHSSEFKTVSSNSSSGLGSATLPYCEENHEVGGSQRSDDDASLVEMERMQQKIREKMSSKDEDVKYADKIRRSLQDMQAKLRHLSAKQREHRQQLGIQLKQQAATPGSQQQQQEARMQLQNMTRRQQQLLKLLQSHKELAASLQQMQHTEHSPLAQSIISGKSNAKNKLQEGKPTRISQTSSGDDLSKKSSLPGQEGMLMQKEKEMMPPSFNLPSTQVSKTQTQSKPTPEITSTRTFKPPFKAHPTKRPHQLKSPSSVLADSSSNSMLNPGKDEVKLTSASVPDKSKSLTNSLVRDTSVSITNDNRRSPSKSPPYSPLTGISTGEYLSETTGLLVKEGISDYPRGKNQNDQPSQREAALRTEGFSIDSLEQDATMTTLGLAAELHNNLPEKARATTTPNVSATNQPPVPLSSNPVSKTSRGATQASSLQTDSISVDSIAKQKSTSQRTETTSAHAEKFPCSANLLAQTKSIKETTPLVSPTKAPLAISSNPVSEFPQTTKSSTIPNNTQTLVNQLLTSIQNKDLNSRRGTDTSGSTSASSQPRKVIVYKINVGTMNDPGAMFSSKSTLDTVVSSVSTAGTVPTTCHIENVGSTTLLRSNSIQIKNQRQQRQDQSLSSSSSNSSLLLTQFQTPATSSFSVPSSTCSVSVPRAIVSKTSSTTSPRSKISTTGKETITITGTQTQTSSNLKETTEKHKKPASSNAKTTVEDLSSQNQRPSSHHNSKSSSDEDDIPSLQNLLQKGLITPGENVLSIKLKRGTVNNSLNSDGTVRPTTELKNFTSGSISLCHMVSLVKRKSLNWIRQNPSIWKSVLYRGKPLDKLHADYKALIARDLQLQSQSNAGNQAMQAKAATTKTNAQSSIQEPPPSRSNSGSAHPPPPSQQHAPASTSQDLSTGTSSRGPAITSRGHDLMTLGHRITTSTAQDVNSSVNVGLVSSMKKILLISDDELVPASWGISSNFRSTDDFRNAAIAPEWIDEIDVWT